MVSSLIWLHIYRIFIVCVFFLTSSLFFLWVSDHLFFFYQVCGKCTVFYIYNSHSIWCQVNPLVKRVGRCSLSWFSSQWHWVCLPHRGIFSPHITSGCIGQDHSQVSLELSWLPPLGDSTFSLGQCHLQWLRLQTNFFCCCWKIWLLSM